jgi:hypothetical protein
VREGDSAEKISGREKEKKFFVLALFEIIAYDKISKSRVQERQNKKKHYYKMESKANFQEIYKEFKNELSSEKAGKLLSFIKACSEGNQLNEPLWIIGLSRSGKSTLVSKLDRFISGLMIKTTSLHTLKTTLTRNLAILDDRIITKADYQEYQENRSAYVNVLCLNQEKPTWVDEKDCIYLESPSR